MPQYKVGTRINLQKNKQREARLQAITNTILILAIGGLAVYGLLDIIFTAGA